MKNYYEWLEIDKNASQEIIDKVYKLLVKKYHPDLQKENKKIEYEEKLKHINEAYDILSNPEKRKQYDLELNTNFISNEEYIKIYNENQILKKQLNELKYYINNNQKKYYSSTNNYYDKNQYNNFYNKKSQYQKNYNNNFYNQNTQNNNYQKYYTNQNNTYNKNTNKYSNININKKYYKNNLSNSIKNIISFILTILILFLLCNIPAFRDFILSLL